MKQKTVYLLLLFLIAASLGLTIFFTAKNSRLPDLNQQESVSSQPTLAAESRNGFVEVDAIRAKELIEEKLDLVILDVSSQFESGHLPGAVNYYVGDGSLDRVLGKLDKARPYLVYCHIDSAAISGATKLVEAGFKEVYRLTGNYSGWVNNGFPVETSDKNATEVSF